MFDRQQNDNISKHISFDRFVFNVNIRRIIDKLYPQAMEYYFEYVRTRDDFIFLP
uniref:Uncharacterized protein n=1 Tax=Candidatus Kentrum sp. LFY TaxID=2126342 RepID=A0A450UJZ7_9GAMM|nr:MAG: hypothetical protein BECKLFY1418B_GA0070995_103916 [Candidatus Kentron sp. LFY]VFJ94368.1 MAG: hypothetical protein BECKLFY1418A_GA0070994_103917 [Candidatus Kentron sp. LFY]VFK18562.1 MAG: hypothetical protein BECKLFY1418C_GA0070996_104517 [Candidatus Kentron sp. LFY]